jgi:hypothetical protein
MNLRKDKRSSFSFTAIHSMLQAGVELADDSELESELAKFAEVWRSDAGHRVPTRQRVESLLAAVGRRVAVAVLSAEVAASVVADHHVFCRVSIQQFSRTKQCLRSN